MVTVDGFEMVKLGIPILFELGLVIFYTYAYSTLSNEERLETEYVLFIIYLSLNWIRNGFALKPLIMGFKYYHETIEMDIWNLLIVKSKIYNVLTLINFALGIYFLVIVEFCDGLGCRALQIIACYALLEISVLIFLIINIIIGSCFKCNYITWIITILQRYNPIPESHLTTQCCICTSYIDQDYHQKWMSLPCKHVIHRECLTRWMLYDQCCPHCKREILLVDTFNYLF